MLSSCLVKVWYDVTWFLCSSAVNIGLFDNNWFTATFPNKEREQEINCFWALNGMKIIAVKEAFYEVVKRRPEKKSGLLGKDFLVHVIYI